MTVLDDFIKARKEYRKAIKKAYKEQFYETPTYERSLELQEFVKEKKEEVEKKGLILKAFIKEEVEPMIEEIKEEIEPVEPEFREIADEFETTYVSPTWSELESKRPFDYFERKYENWKSFSEKKLQQTILDYFEVKDIPQKLPVADFTFMHLTGKGMDKEFIKELRREI